MARRPLMVQPGKELTSGEQEILGRLRQGKSAKTIAQELCISDRTLAMQVTTLLEKMSDDAQHWIRYRYCAGRSEFLPPQPHLTKEPRSKSG